MVTKAKDPAWVSFHLPLLKENSRTPPCFQPPQLLWLSSYVPLKKLMYWKFALSEQRCWGRKGTFEWWDLCPHWRIKVFETHSSVGFSRERPCSESQPPPPLLPSHHQLSSFDLPHALDQDGCTLAQVQEPQSPVNMGWNLRKRELKSIIPPFSWFSQILCHKTTQLTHQP